MKSRLGAFAVAALACVLGLASGCGTEGGTRVPEQRQGPVLKNADKAVKLAWGTVLSRRFASQSLQCVRALRDGGCIAAGSCRSGFSAYLVRFDGQGNVLWEKDLGPARKRTKADWVLESRDGTLVVKAHRERAMEPYTSSYLIKTTGAGDVIWEKVLPFGGPMGHASSGLEEATDGSLLDAVTVSEEERGVVRQSIKIWRADSKGNVVWQREVCEDGYRCAYFGATASGGYFIIANSTSLTKNRIYICMIRSDGSTEWTTVAQKQLNDMAYCGIDAMDGGLVLVGSRGRGEQREGLLLRIGKSGEVLKEVVYGSQGADVFRHVIRSRDGHLVVGGETHSLKEGLCDALLMKIDSEGKIVWRAMFGGGGNDYGRCVAEMAAGMFVLVGDADGYGSLGDAYAAAVSESPH